ncbi:MAG: family 16 glycosylhydrolase [Spirochaetales bacterium]|nr:family 16 glycosylhydrolase [Spirochaetales bacterium]
MKNRWLVFISCLLLLNFFPAFSQTNLLGDANRDGRVNIVDALLVAQFYIGLMPSGFIQEAVDVDYNCSINIVDALLIAQYYVGLIKEFPGNGLIYSFTGNLNNGLINGVPVNYGTISKYSNGVVTISFDGGPGFEWVWLYSPEHKAMVKGEGTVWTADLGSYSEGLSLEYYFVVRKNGFEANNNDQPHRLVVSSSANGNSGGCTELPEKSPAPGEWRIVWEDNFDGSNRPDQANWNYHVGNGYNRGSGGFGGWGNGEWEWYRPENAYQHDGKLVIRADYLNSPVSIANRDWFQFSSRITTQGKHAWKYGRFEALIALPSAAGTWPAFWMLGESCDASFIDEYNPPMDYYDDMAGNWSSCGEIDIMEHRNSENLVVHNLFWDTRIGLFPWEDGLTHFDPRENVPVDDVTLFHLYTIEWNEKDIRWYVDRETHQEPTKIMNITADNMEEYHKPFFLIFNLALQGGFTGPTDPVTSDFPLYMYIDYVRVWQKN